MDFYYNNGQLVTRAGSHLSPKTSSFDRWDSAATSASAVSGVSMGVSNVMWTANAARHGAEAASSMSGFAGVAYAVSSFTSFVATPVVRIFSNIAYYRQLKRENEHIRRLNLFLSQNPSLVEKMNEDIEAENQRIRDYNIRTQEHNDLLSEKLKFGGKLSDGEYFLPYIPEKDKVSLTGYPDNGIDSYSYQYFISDFYITLGAIAAGIAIALTNVIGIGIAAFLMCGFVAGFANAKILNSQWFKKTDEKHDAKEAWLSRHSDEYRSTLEAIEKAESQVRFADSADEKKQALNELNRLIKSRDTLRKALKQEFKNDEGFKIHWKQNSQTTAAKITRFFVGLTDRVRRIENPGLRALAHVGYNMMAPLMGLGLIVYGLFSIPYNLIKKSPIGQGIIKAWNGVKNFFSPKRSKSYESVNSNDYAPRPEQNISNYSPKRQALEKYKSRTGLVGGANVGLTFVSGAAMAVSALLTVLVVFSVANPIGIGIAMAVAAVGAIGAVFSNFLAKRRAKKQAKMEAKLQQEELNEIREKYPERSTPDFKNTIDKNAIDKNSIDRKATVKNAMHDQVKSMDYAVKSIENEVKSIRGKEYKSRGLDNDRRPSVPESEGSRWREDDSSTVPSRKNSRRSSFS